MSPNLWWFLAVFGCVALGLAIGGPTGDVVIWVGLILLVSWVCVAAVAMLYPSTP